MMRRGMPGMGGFGGGGMPGMGGAMGGAMGGKKTPPAVFSPHNSRNRTLSRLLLYERCL
jgi:hypothetical protein